MRVSHLIALLIRARRFTALTTLEAGKVGSSDAEQLQFATSQGMALLTHNRLDFSALARGYADQNRHHCGIVLAMRRPPYELARRLLGLLNRLTADEIDDRILFI